LKTHILRIPIKSINWTNSIFLIGTFLLTITAVPIYLAKHGLEWFQGIFFLVSFILTGLSITLGYHRLFSHLTFQARWPVKLATLLFGSSAFEGSVLEWARDHREHHKHVDHDDDPYDISKGFFYAHIGWLLFKVKSDHPLTNVSDLQQDKLVAFQHKYYVPVALTMGFIVPTLIGWAWGGPTAALGSFLIAGVARIVFVQHMTFFINSMCHTVGRRPYSSKCSARDSGVMAFFTFGEGYNNYHHEFQHDYRNGVKPWQFDPTKWTIWTLHKLGLAKNLRRVPDEKRILAEISEEQRYFVSQLETKGIQIPESVHSLLQSAHDHLVQTAKKWEQCKAEYMRATEKKMAASKDKVEHLKHQFQLAAQEFQLAIQKWKETHQLAQMQLA
jgi:stearoyl-CoA desaturase (delta-9 desaturase)